MRTAVVINLNARRFVRQPSLIAETERRAQRAYRTRTPAELERAVSALLDWGARRVVFCGGDGTLMVGATALFAQTPSPPEVVLARAGTVATVARNWRQGEGLLETVSAATAGMPPKRRFRSPTLSVIADDEPRRVGFIFGAGLVANFFERYYREAGAGGYRAAAQIVARVFAGSFVGTEYATSIVKPVVSRLRVDGHLQAARAFSLVAASVVPDLGLHLHLTYRAAEQPMRFHLVAAPLPAKALSPQLPRVLLGKRLRGEGCLDALAGEFELSFPGRGHYVLDGELLSTSTVRVGAGPLLPVATF